MMVTRCYKYRLRPTVAQVEILVQWAGCRRWLWNWALQRKQAHYAATGGNLGYNALAGELVDLKRQPATLWLKDCVAQSLQQVLIDLETAFANFFAKRAKYPRWKSRKTTPHSLRFPQCVTVVDGQTISVPKIGLMNRYQHLHADAQPQSRVVWSAGRSGRAVLRLIQDLPLLPAENGLDAFRSGLDVSHLRHDPRPRCECGHQHSP